MDIPYNHPAWIEIDLVQFKKNLYLIKQHIGEHTKLCLPVKANAYGHGMIPMARAAVEANVDCLAVSCLQEGILLRQANINIPILVLGAIHHEQVLDFINNDLEFTVASLFKAKLVAEQIKHLNKKVKVHLEVDTGMHRTGVRVETAPAVLDFMRGHPCFEIKGVYSHLATADDPHHPFSYTQIDLFLDFLREANLIGDPNIICHLANSAGTACMPETHLDMVRPGLLAFGYHPRSDMPDVLRAIQPCLTIKAKVAYFKNVPMGKGISYNHTYVTPDNVNLLTIPVGYGDGFRRALSNKGHILLNGSKYPIVGNVCMDQFMVNIGANSGYVGDIVTLIGKEGDEEVKIVDHSALCGTIPYEILCGFNNRLPRIYHDATQSRWEHETNIAEVKAMS